MRSIKTSGGLTRGRGITELQRAIWLLSTPACGEINLAMQQVTGVNYEFSEQQHKEATKSRKEKDYEDAIAVMTYLHPRCPFDGRPDLVNIHTGEVADKDVNVDEALAIGNKILESAKDELVSSFTFKRKEQAIVMKPDTVLTLKDDVVVVDPQLLFQRLIASVRDIGVDVDLETAFSYELCTYPASLISTDGLLRTADKPKLADELWKVVGKSQTEVPMNDVHYVLDGGSFMQRIKWVKGMYKIRFLQLPVCGGH